MYNQPVACPAIDSICSDGTLFVILIYVKCIVCVCSLIVWPAALAVERPGHHRSALILTPHQLPSISPTGALYDVCQLITSDSI